MLLSENRSFDLRDETLCALTRELPIKNQLLRQTIRSAGLVGGTYHGKSVLGRPMTNGYFIAHVWKKWTYGYCLNTLQAGEFSPFGDTGSHPNLNISDATDRSLLLLGLTGPLRSASL